MHLGISLFPVSLHVHTVKRTQTALTNRSPPLSCSVILKNHDAQDYGEAAAHKVWKTLTRDESQHCNLKWIHPSTHRHERDIFSCHCWKLSKMS